ncbi:hypothetical protein SDC9_75509 [bioreactor metagenome]|uniref:Uncharacterized protein n=1 Tax=bioreactor metagenome TaxID=1076179 RepID=A0A644YM68_9ZZZZ
MYDFRSKAGDPDKQENKRNLKLQRDEGLGALDADLILRQKRSDQRNGRCDPSGHHRVSKQGMQAVEKSVDNYHGKRKVVRYAKNLGKHRDCSKTGSAHEKRLAHLRERPPIVDERKPYFKNARRDVRLLRAVSSESPCHKLPPFQHVLDARPFLPPRQAPVWGT